MEQGQFVSMTYPTLHGGVRVSNVQSVNGSLLSKSIKREERKGQLELDNLNSSWVRSTWEPFSAHATRFAFVYNPNSRDYTNEVAMATMEGELKSPKNTGRGDRMSISMNLRMQFADEFKI